MPPLSLWRLSWREWRHHPWRHGMALLAVALGVALAWSVHLINASALAEFSAAVRSANGEPDLSLRGAARRLRRRAVRARGHGPGRGAGQPGARARHLRTLGAAASAWRCACWASTRCRSRRWRRRCCRARRRAQTALAALDPQRVFLNAARARAAGREGRRARWRCAPARSWQSLTRGRRRGGRRRGAGGDGHRRRAGALRHGAAG